MREALPLLHPRAASPAETRLRLFLRTCRVPAPAIDFDVYAAGGLHLGTSELAFPEYRVALEYEGDHHRTERAQWNRDIEKYRDYESAGWTVIRVTAHLLFRDQAELRHIVETALARRGYRAERGPHRAMPQPPHP